MSYVGFSFTASNTEYKVVRETANDFKIIAINREKKTEMALGKSKFKEYVSSGYYKPKPAVVKRKRIKLKF